MRILADTNIVAQAVCAMRDAGHDVVYAAERTVDPGDAALLAEAVSERRVFVTKDHDIGVLVHRDRHDHFGVLLVDDLGNATTETTLILSAIVARHQDLIQGGFLRCGESGIRRR